VLLHICKSHAAFVKKHLTDLKHILLDEASFSSSSKRARLNALGYIIESLPPAQFQVMSELLVDVVISTKEANAKTRSAAFDILLRVGRKMKQKDEKKKKKLEEEQNNYMSDFRGGDSKKQKKQKVCHFLDHFLLLFFLQLLLLPSPSLPTILLHFRFSLPFFSNPSPPPPN
jgi:hypothetical protein